MSELPYNLPTLSGDVIVAFSKYPNGTTGFPHLYSCFIYPETPQFTFRAGGIASLTLGSRTITPSANIIGTITDASQIPGGALSYNIPMPNNEHSTLYIWCQLGLDGRIYWELTMVGPGNDGGAIKQFPFSATIEFTITTTDVLDDDDNVILRGGEFTFPVQIAIMPRDLPFSVVSDSFFEFYVGETVKKEFFIQYHACYHFEFVGCGYGCNFPGSNLGRDIISPTGAESGLTIETFEVTVGDETYIAGVRISGTASRPGLYLAYIWSQSNTVTAPGSGGGGTLSSEFPAGDNGELIIISIRDRKPLPGDPLLLLPHDADAVPNTRFSVTYNELNDTDDFGANLTAETPYDVFEYREGVWDEAPVWQQPPDSESDFDTWYDAWLNDDPDADEAINTDVQYTPTGYTHLAGHWFREVRVEIKDGDTVISVKRWWFVICRDQDTAPGGQVTQCWRLYCACDTNTVIPWTAKATTPEIGLDNETPPKYWPSIKLFGKGAEKYIVDGAGVFAWAGTFDYLPPDAEEGDEPLALGVFQQQPIETPQYAGGTRDGVAYPDWSDLDFYPAKYQFNAGKLLYQHPALGWVLVDTITDVPTEANKVSPLNASCVGIPFQPIAPPMVVGNNPEAIRRDPLLSDGVRGIGISNTDGDGGMRNFTPGVAPWHSPKLVLMGGMAAAGYFDGGIIWPHYPLPRMVNFERLRMHVVATVKTELLGGALPLDVAEGAQTWWDTTETYATGVPNLPPAEPPAYGEINHVSHAKSHSIHRLESYATGKCIAALDIEVPCWYNGYILFGELRDLAAGMTASGAYDNSVTFKSGEHTDYKNNGDRYLYISERGAWTRDNHMNISDDNREVEILRWDGVKYGTLTADRCKISVYMRGVVGHGREIDLCPPKITNSDRPSAQIVFAGNIGIAAEWHFAGNCQYQDTKYDYWKSKHFDNDLRDQPGHDGWYYKPQPADSTPESSTIEFTYSVGRDWTCGLQAWEIGGGNPLHGEFVGEHRFYKQRGGYSLYEGQDLVCDVAANGECRFDSGVGETSGRTTFDDIDPENPTQVVQFPLEFYGGSASGRVTTYTSNGTKTNVATTERQYPTENTAHPTAAGALAVYEECRKLVEECDAEYPALPDYRADGAARECDFLGWSSEDHRRDDIDLTITLAEENNP